MKADAIPTSLITNHPPLAHDAQGCKLALPDGTSHWRILRHTGGRPKPLPGPDSQPARFGLEMTHEDLLELCGPGKYRIEALDEFGNLLACVATLTVGGDTTAPPVELVANNNLRAYAGNDLRIAMETITALTRANSESLQTLANAQADWIKTLATSKAIPRNASAPMLMAPSPAELATEEPKAGWLALLEPAMPAIATALLRNIGSFFRKDEPEPPRRNASAATHVARIRAQLAPEERKLFDRILLDETVAEPLVATLCERDVASGAAFIREKIKATPPKPRHLPSFEEHVSGVCALLAPEEREAATALLNGWIRTLAADTFLRTTPAEGAEFIRTLMTNAAKAQAES